MPLISSKRLLVLSLLKWCRSESFCSRTAIPPVPHGNIGPAVYELPHLLVPTIVLAQNAQELHHSFASPRWGCLNLGLGADVPPAVIQSTFRSLLESRPLRQGLRQAMQSVDLTRGRQAVVRHILELE